MAITLNEPIVKQLQTILAANLPAEVTAINAAANTVADGFTIEDPAQVLDFVPPVEYLTTFPTVAIGDGPSTFADDNAWSATGRHTLFIVCFLQDPDQQALAWRLRRYEQALIRVVLANRNLGTAAWGTVLDGIDPGPTLVDDPKAPQTWLSWAGIRIVAHKDEE